MRIAARVISVPWRERFAEKRHRLGAAPVTVSLEAGVSTGWHGIAPAARIGVETFGVWGPRSDVLTHFGLTADAVAQRVHTLVSDLRGA